MIQIDYSIIHMLQVQLETFLFVNVNEQYSYLSFHIAAMRICVKYIAVTTLIKIAQGNA